MAVLDEVGELLRSLRGVWDEDAVDELEHALQAAARARDDGADDELVLAAALHDLAHSPRVRRYRAASTTTGRPWTWLTPRFGDRVGWLAGAHVAAKRYLVATDPDYATTLSDVSVDSLHHQGGAHVDAASSVTPGGPTRCGCGATTTQPRIRTAMRHRSMTCWRSRSAYWRKGIQGLPDDLAAADIEALPRAHGGRRPPCRPRRGRRCSARARARGTVRGVAGNGSPGPARAVGRGTHRAAWPRHRGVAAETRPAAVAAGRTRRAPPSADGCRAACPSPGRTSRRPRKWRRRWRFRRATPSCTWSGCCSPTASASGWRAPICPRSGSAAFTRDVRPVHVAVCGRPRHGRGVRLRRRAHRDGPAVAARGRTA